MGIISKNIKKNSVIFVFPGYVVVMDRINWIGRI